MSSAADELLAKLFDGLPSSDDEPDQGEKLPRNLARCPACNAKVRTDLPGQDRVRDHELTVDCLIRRTGQAYKARGWTRAQQWGPVLERAGLPVERAPVSKSQVPYEEAPEPWRSRARQSRRGGYSMVDVPVDGPWAPREHVAVAQEVSGVELPAVARHALIRRMLSDPETRQAVLAARRLGGDAALAAYGRRHSELAMEALGPEPPPADRRRLARAVADPDDQDPGGEK